MKNHINLMTFVTSHYKLLLTATVLLLGLIGDAPPGW